jgi:hypothetical protein
MNSTGEDILDDILLGDMEDGIHTLQKTVSVAKLCLFCSSFPTISRLVEIDADP